MDGQDEDSKVEILTAMMGNSDPETARRVLRKFNGNVDSAAQSLLEGGGGLTVADTARISRDDDDAEMSRALRASLEESGIGGESSGQSQLRPSDRAPDLNWALTTVPSNVPVELSQEDQSLNRAIQESLSQTWDQGTSEAFTQRPLADMVRNDNRPVALRPSDASLVYAALVLQALCYIPQVRQKLALWASTATEDTPGDRLRKKAYKVVEMFANMDLAVLSEIIIDDLLEELGISAPPSGVPHAPGDVSAAFFRELSTALESAIYNEEAMRSHDWPRLFFFRHASAKSAPPTGSFDPVTDRSSVRVDIGGDDDDSDLLTCLTNLLASDSTSGPEVIFDTSDVITFHLVRREALPTYSGTVSQSRTLFRYPKVLYLDQFMRENYEVVAAGRAQQRKTLDEIQTLNLRKSALTHFKGKDVIKDLTTTLHYYEDIANKSTPERKISVEDTTRKLRKILTKIQNEIQTVDTEISTLKARSAEALESADLQNHRYDLRVVLVHDGQFGRSHVYSYVYDKGKWWMTIDYNVQEVPEDIVLRDSSGLHYGAGPYMLFYSRATGQDASVIQWPESLKSAVHHNNEEFLKSMSQEKLGDTQSDSALTSYATPSSMIANASPAELELMDVTE